MTGLDNTKLHWFLFTEEPSYVLRFGPKYEASETFSQVVTDFKSQSRKHYHGLLSYNDYCDWNDKSLPFDILSLVWKGSKWNHKEEDGYSHIVCLFTPSTDFGDHYHHFDYLRIHAEESAAAMCVIETIASLIRYAPSMKQWLGFAVTYSQ